MPRLILKSPYLKPNQNQHLLNYVRYMATREGVMLPKSEKDLRPVLKTQEKLLQELLQKYPDVKDLFEYEDYRSAPNRENAHDLIMAVLEAHPELLQERKGYISYMANRPGVEKIIGHGLFSAGDSQPDIAKVQEELSEYSGNVWTHIISLRRKDAARFGYDSVETWQALLTRNAMQIAAAMQIKPENFRWCAAFHNESHHPHVHMIAWSIDPKEAYLTTKGIEKIKARLAQDIFNNDLLEIYTAQTKTRDELRQESREKLQTALAEIEQGSFSDPVLEELLARLSHKLKQTKGKKVYGYLPKETKKLVDAVVDRLELDPRIAALYDVWYEQRFEVLRTYTDTLPEKLPLSQNKDFKPIRNAVVEIAMEMAGTDLLEADLPDGEITAPVEKRQGGNWWTREYKSARACLYGTVAVEPNLPGAYAHMRKEAESGNPLAQHDFGLMLLKGMGCEKDETQAQEWLQKALRGFRKEESRSKKKGYWQYRIGKMYAMGYGIEQDYLTAADWYERALTEQNPFAAYALGSLYHRGQGVEQDEERAFELFLMAAVHEEMPNAYAMYEVAKMYHVGIGTTADEERSQQWYVEAYRAFQSIVRELPDDRVLYRLGYLSLHGLGTERSKDTAFDYFRKAANLKNEDAVFALGKLYLDPECASFDPAKGIACLEKAAEEFHHSNAAYLLGKVYYKGEVVPKDVNAALPYLFRAANEQNPYALYLLGKLYAYGDGVEQDLEYAKTLLVDSAMLGNEFAQRLLDRLNNPRFDSEYDLLPSALALFRQAARIFENKLDNDPKISRTVDRKLLSKIADKKLAQGLKLE